MICSYSPYRFLRLMLSLVVVAGPVVIHATAQPFTETIKAGRYDNGKMWAFEYPPLEYLSETYDFEPDETWFERARMSVLRIPGCSASFVSPNGLVVTNHHCVRGRLPSVSESGEKLLDTGFYAPSLDAERRIPGYYADQLIAIEDVTAEVETALEGVEGAEARTQKREAVFEAITQRVRTQYSDTQNMQVQIIALYNGGRYSAYVFRRYTDIRFVFAVELQLGFFGGDGDNFTYPRYALDFAFLRVYGEDGKPVSSPHHFAWSEEGVSEGDLIFVIGNPGSTSRQATVSQLEYFRDVFVDHTLATLNKRLEVFRAFYDEDPETGEALNLRSTIFSISNSQKAYTGRNAALKGPWLIERRADAERQFRDAIAADGELASLYSGVFDELAQVQQEKRVFADEYGAFRYIESSRFSSAIMRRAIQAVRYLRAAQSDSSAATRARAALLRTTDRPAALERRLVRARLEEFVKYFGEDSEIVSEILAGTSVAERTDAIMSSSVLESTESASLALETGTLSLNDPAVAIAHAIFDRYSDYAEGFRRQQVLEQELQRQVGEARFAVYGVSVPSDATFSPRFTDGVVKSYEYNGTLAPPYTTLFGLMDHYYSYGGHPDWSLPERWQNPPADLNLGTPLNFISTSDTIGGNSGSPAVTRNLELVGLNFDRNIEGLSRDYIFLPDRGRNIMVDMRSVRETLDKIYDADRIVLELTTGTMAETEEAADAIQANQ